jgi:hypothetical protein
MRNGLFEPFSAPQARIGRGNHCEGLRSLQSRYWGLTDEPNYIDSVFTEGASKIRPYAQRSFASNRRVDEANITLLEAK